MRSQRKEIHLSDTNRKLMSLSVTGSESDWPAACQRAALDDGFYASFRSNSTFLRVVEGTPRLAGQQILARWKNDPVFRSMLPIVAEQDCVGNPKSLVNFLIDRDSLALSPTTLRYVNNALNCFTIFGESLFAYPICEIGAGYGGEFLVFQKMAQVQEKNFVDWSIFDLSTSTDLIKKFTSQFSIERPKFRNIYSPIDDLSVSPFVISNGALSEMRGQLLEDYIEILVKPAVGGYFLVNFDSHSLPYGGVSNADFVSTLKKMGKPNVALLNAKRFLTNFDDASGTALVIFGDLIVSQPKSNTLMNTMEYGLRQFLETSLQVMRRKSSAIIRGADR